MVRKVEDDAEDNHVYPSDHAIYRSDSPRVVVAGIRHGHGRCNVLWIRASESEWVLLPHGVPSLAVHLSAEEVAAMVDRLSALRTGR